MQNPVNHETGIQTVAALQKNNFESTYFKNREDAVSHILSLIPQRSIIGIGGSIVFKPQIIKINKP